MAKGRKNVPSNIVALRGGRNHTHRPGNKEEPRPDASMPNMPAWLAEFPIAVQLWEYESKQLHEMGVLTQADPNTFAMRCYIGAQIQELAKDIKEEGRSIQSLIKIDKRGNPVYGSKKTNPKCIQLTSLLSEYRQTSALYGLDPSSRVKLKAEKPKPIDEGEEFLKSIKK